MKTWLWIVVPFRGNTKSEHELDWLTEGSDIVLWNTVLKLKINHQQETLKNNVSYILDYHNNGLSNTSDILEQLDDNTDYIFSIEHDWYTAKFTLSLPISDIEWPQYDNLELEDIALIKLQEQNPDIASDENYKIICLGCMWENWFIKEEK
jgi:hypothetical protein